MIEKVYEELKEMKCYEMFWGYSVLKRGNMYVFEDENMRIISHLHKKTLHIDTIFYSLTNNCFNNLLPTPRENLEKMANCIDSISILRIDGFEFIDCKMMRFSLNDDVDLYYISSIDDNKVKPKCLTKDNITFIDEHWFYKIDGECGNAPNRKLPQ